MEEEWNGTLPERDNKSPIGILFQNLESNDLIDWFQLVILSFFYNQLGIERYWFVPNKNNVYLQFISVYEAFEQKVATNDWICA